MLKRDLLYMASSHEQEISFSAGGSFISSSEDESLVCFIQPGYAEKYYGGAQIFVSKEAVADVVTELKKDNRAIKMYDGHKPREERFPVRDVVSYINPESIRLAKEGEFAGVAVGSAVGNIVYSNNQLVSHLREDLQRNGNIYELSIMGIVTYTFLEKDGKDVALLESIDKLISVDWVDEGAAKGTIIAAEKDREEQLKTLIRTSIESRIKPEWFEKIEAALPAAGIKEISAQQLIMDLGFIIGQYLISLKYSAEDSEEFEKGIKNMIDSVVEILSDINYKKLLSFKEPEKPDSKEDEMGIEELRKHLSELSSEDQRFIIERTDIFKSQMNSREESIKEALEERDHEHEEFKKKIAKLEAEREALEEKNKGIEEEFETYKSDQEKAHMVDEFLREHEINSPGEKLREFMMMCKDKKELETEFEKFISSINAPQIGLILKDKSDNSTESQSNNSQSDTAFDKFVTGFGK